MIENLNVFVAKLLPKEEYFVSGHRACSGCGPALALRLVTKALGRNTIVANATGCMEIISSSYPETAWKIPWMHVAFENAAAVASGIESGLNILMKKGKIQKRKINVLGLGGDGGTADIGLQALSGALERGHDMIYIMYDNEAYMNTGIQRSGSTPFGAQTSTSPSGKISQGQKTWKKDMAQIAVAHHIPYVATANHSFPFDLISKVRKAAAVEGPAFIHLFTVCPVGWRTDSQLTVKLGRLATLSGMFPLYEVINGKYIISIKPEKLTPLKEYTSLQGRFRHLPEDVILQIEKRVHLNYEELLKKEL